MPELFEQEDSIWLSAVHGGIEATVGAVLSLMAYGVPCSAIDPPAAVASLFEKLADREDGLSIMLRTQRVAIGELWRLWAEHVHAAQVGSDREHALLVSSTGFMFHYLDRVSGQLIDRWAAARRRRQQGIDVPAEELIRRALFGGGDDELDLQRLSYEAERYHVALGLPGTLDEATIAQFETRAKRELHACAESQHPPRGWVDPLARFGARP